MDQDMKMMFTRYSVCNCGFPILRDEVPIGTVFEVDEKITEDFSVICGGCGKWNHVVGVWVRQRADRHAGFLPKDIFEPYEKEQHKEGAD